MKLSRSFAPYLVFASASCFAACGGHAGHEPGGGSSQARQADVTGVPLFFTRFGSNLTYEASEVDDAGNTYVVDERSFTANFIDVFDPSGAHVSTTQLPTGPRRVDRGVRVNDTGVLVFGTYSPNDGVAITSEALIDRLDAGLSPLFHYVGAKDTYARAGDVCADGTTVVVLQAASQTLDAFDTSGNVVWSADVPASLAMQKARCYGSGNIVTAGWTMDANGLAHVFVAQYESDGTMDWTFSAAETASSSDRVTFDVDNDGNPYVGATLAGGGTKTMVLYALDTSGALRWTWTSNGSNDVLAGVSAGDVVAVTGARNLSGTSHYLTAMFDTSGGVTFTREDPFGGSQPASATGIMLDGVDDPFVCGTVGSDTGATLYDATSGSSVFLDDTEASAARTADVTNGIGRCIGQGGGGTIGLLGYQVH